ncbi:MAG: glycoside hydrolase family 27 protein, partial [Solirubrobacterales bacterium]|nr:glycoside hydrolase family 27 protein [Solirubrobacterales bacterium]
LYVTPGISKQAVTRHTRIAGTPYTADQIAEPLVSERNYNCGGMVGIDYSKPGAQQFVDSWADQMADWGVDYVKIDGVGDSDVPDIRAWSQALQQTHRPIHLELSNQLDIKNAATWQQYSNGWRTGNDVECACGPNDAVYPLTDWTHVSARFDQAAAWAPYGGPGGYNDYDSIEIGNGNNDGLTPAERKSQLSLWALASSPLLLGTDLTKLDPADLALLKNQAVIGVDQDGIDATRLAQTSTEQVFAKTEQAGVTVAGLFDTGSSGTTVTTSTQALGLPQASHYTVTDLWSGKSSQTTGTIHENVPSHGVALIRVTAQD